MIRKKINILFLILCCCFLKKATAQHWDSLNSGLDLPSVYSMYADSADNYLYIGGYFYTAGGVPMGGIVRWDGNSYSPMAYAGLSTSIRSITRYHDTIYACGNFTSVEQDVKKWNGSSWDLVGHVYNGGIYNFFEFNNELYAMGIFDSIANLGSRSNSIAKWNGSSWSTIKDTSFNAQVYCMAVYNNEIYIAGNFYNPVTGVWRIAKWNGINFVPLNGGGIIGGGDEVIDMVVYKNELYVSGNFSKADGNVGNFIQKWDGTMWSEVGGGVLGPPGDVGEIRDMKVYGNELYVVGLFATAGGIPASHIAKWDGTNWCGFGSTFDNNIAAIAFKNGEMYIGGGFYTVDSDSISGVAKWIGGSYIDTCGYIAAGINEVVINNEELNIYPNPATNQITIEFNLIDNQHTFIEVKNVLGQTVKKTDSGFSTGKNQIEIDMTEFCKGLYFIQLQNGNKLHNKKVIKE